MNNPCIRKGAAAIALLSGLAWISPAVAQQPPQPSPLPTQPQPPPAPPKQPAFMPEVVVTATGYPEEVSKIAGTVQVISQDRIAHSNAKSVTELLAENSVGFMSQWTAGQTSHQHPRRRHRRPGPRFQERSADPDQQPSCRHRQHLQAVDRRRRARRDRPWPGLRRLRQPEHGRRDQHHPEDRPHRRARHLHRGGRRLVELCRRQGPERRQHRHLRLVRRRQRRPAGRLSGGWRTGRVEHCLEPLRRHRRVRLADRPEQSHRRDRTIRRRLRHRLSRLERQHLRQRQSLQRFDRLHLERQDAQRPRSLHVPGLLRL